LAQVKCVLCEISNKKLSLNKKPLACYRLLMNMRLLVILFVTATEGLKLYGSQWRNSAEALAAKEWKNREGSNYDFSLSLAEAIKQKVAACPFEGMKQKVVVHGQCDDFAMLTVTDGERGQVPLDAKQLGNKYWIDKKAMTIRVQPGVRFMDVHAALRKEKLSFGSINYIGPTVIGAMSTGSHGSWWCIDDKVISLWVVNGAGVVKQVTKESPDWKAWKLGLGQLGVITEAVYKVEQELFFSLKKVAIHDMSTPAANMKYSEAFKNSGHYSNGFVNLWQNMNGYMGAITDIGPTNATVSTCVPSSLGTCYGKNTFSPFWYMGTGNDVRKAPTYENEVATLDGLATFGSMGTDGNPKDIYKNNPMCKIEQDKKLTNCHPMLVNVSEWVLSTLPLPASQLGTVINLYGANSNIAVNIDCFDKTMLLVSRAFDTPYLSAVAWLRKIPASTDPSLLTPFGFGKTMVVFDIFHLGVEFDIAKGLAPDVAWMLQKLRSATAAAIQEATMLGCDVAFHWGKAAQNWHWNPKLLQEFDKHKKANDPCGMFTNLQYEYMLPTLPYSKKYQGEGHVTH